jgi:hypothetical protein
MDELAAIANANGGYLMRGQLIDLGITDDEIRGRCRAGDLKRIRHGTYVVGAEWSLLDDVRRHVVLARSVLDKLGDAVVATHQTACALHGLDLWGCDLSSVHVTRVDGRQGRREAGVIHHQGAVTESDVVEIDGRLAIQPIRSAIEVATQSIEVGMVVISSMMRVTATEKNEVRARIDALRHWPGIRAADVAARLSDGRLESVGEARSLFMFWRFKLPFPELQRGIVSPAGMVVARPDFFWETYRHTGEFDGMVKYGRLNPYVRDVGRVLTDEKAREDAIRSQGLGMTRWTWAELGTHVQARTASRIREEMERSRRLYARDAVHIV